MQTYICSVSDLRTNMQVLGSVFFKTMCVRDFNYVMTLILTKLRRMDIVMRIEKTIPAFAAMHGPHSLVRIGPGCANRA